LSDLWSGIKSSVPPAVKDRVKANLFSPEQQKKTEAVNDLHQKLK
jgi:hypothetical protein